MATPSVSVLILGAGGDLTKRLLLPGLASLLSIYDYDVQVIGSSMEDRTDEEWKQLIRDSFSQVQDPKDADRYLESTQYIKADATSQEDLEKLIAACEHTPVIYFALPRRSPRRCAARCAGWSCPRAPGWRWRSPSASTRSRRASSTASSAASCRRSRSTGSTTSSACRWC
ncbi:hypothetical protein GCM10025866_06710 [Naasia aerilata]|uniref:Glucose-6-phosphate dehydrogenase NAD-binding domain-containing protein n=1 Tax=Naasia aerilata TaxID=1162966 RepID=A0ABM8G989_9MICO|nr:hypothetical protein GCM10025866_06710 [Naasia aerilata]